MKKMLIGFIPWLLLGFMPTHDLKQLSLLMVGILFLTVALDYKHLRHGFILSWGTVLFFSCSVVFVGLLHNVWFAHHIWILSNCTLATIAWSSLIIKQPLTLQFAKEQTTEEQWSSILFLNINKFLTSAWAMIFTLNICVNVIKFYYHNVPNLVYSSITISLITVGVLLVVWLPKWYSKRYLARTKN